MKKFDFFSQFFLSNKKMPTFQQNSRKFHQILHFFIFTNSLKKSFISEIGFLLKLFIYLLIIIEFKIFSNLYILLVTLKLCIKKLTTKEKNNIIEP